MPNPLGAVGNAFEPRAIPMSEPKKIPSDDFSIKKHIDTNSITVTGISASKITITDANKNLASGTNTDAQISSAVTASHTQNTDTALGSGCEAADHGTAATDMVINVCYGTGAEPAANTTTEGTLYVKYTA